MLQQKLTDRLLTNATVSTIAEKNFIAKLRSEAGVAYVTKMTQMLQDLDNSKAEMDKYKKLQHRGRPNGVELNVQVLGNSSWDIDKNKMEKLIIPPILQKCIDDFSGFYVKDRSMYKLDFAFGLVYKHNNLQGSITYALNDNANFFTTKKIEPTSSLIQYLILRFLENHEKLSIKQLTQLLGHSSEEIIAFEANHLIFHPGFNKTRDKKIGMILTDAEKDIAPESNVWLNKEFKPSNLKPSTLPMKMKRIVRIFYNLGNKPKC